MFFDEHAIDTTILVVSISCILFQLWNMFATKMDPMSRCKKKTQKSANTDHEVGTNGQGPLPKSSLTKVVPFKDKSDETTEGDGSTSKVDSLGVRSFS